MPIPPEPSSPSAEGPQEPDPSTAGVSKDRVRRLKEELFGELLSTAEVAEILEVHPRTVGDYIREGRLHAIQIGGGWKVPEDALREFARGLTEAGPPPKRRGMFGRFTEKARAVTLHAKEEASALGHDYIGTEHILLGLLDEPTGVASRALVNLGLDPTTARDAVKDLVGTSSAPKAAVTIFPFTQSAKKVFEYSLREALSLGHKYIGTEHVLLGLMREGEGVGAIVIRQNGIDFSMVLDEVVRLLATDQPSES